MTEDGSQPAHDYTSPADHGSTGDPVRALAELVADLSRKTAAATSSNDALAIITSIALSAIPGANHASVTRNRGGRYETLAPTDDTAARADRLQYELDSGPCIDSTRSVGSYLVPDLATDMRWPVYGPLAARRFGVRAMIARTMVLDENTRASLNLYSDQIDGLTSRSETVAMVISNHAAAHLGRVLAREHADNLQIALVNSRTIGTAIGVLMAARKLTSEHAFTLMCTASQSSNRKMILIADEIVETGTLPTHE